MSVTLQNVLYGIAVADAIGKTLEFMGSPTLQDFERSSQQVELRISDDTQMTLFLAESLSTAKAGSTALKPLMANGYLRWLHTQRTRSPGTGLLEFQSLFHVEAPGNTCISACLAMSRGEVVANDSKGNGTVMRCAPVAFWAKQSEVGALDAVVVASFDARITHLHPYAAQSSMLLTAIYVELLRGAEFVHAVTHSCHYLGDPCLVDPAVISLVLGSLVPSTHDAMKKSLGGWVAEEALALAVGSVARSSGFVEVVKHATVIGGDSDTVGGIAGGLAVASGMEVPMGLVVKLNAKDAIDYVVNLYAGG